jgi:hypothetical protein
MFIKDFGSNNRNKRRGEKIYCPTFFVATNSTKFKIILSWTGKGKIRAKSQRTMNFLLKNLSPSFQNMGLGFGIRDPRSGIRDPLKALFWISDPGVKKAPGSRIRIHNNAY